VRARYVVFVAISTLALAAAVAACADIFHSTDDIMNACEMDAGDACAVADAQPSTDADAADAPDTAIDICAASSKDALARAQTACKWLGACETPMGSNRFAECMVNALTAYDCTIAPNRLFQGDARAFWLCMASADSCAKVDACVFPKGRSKCGTTGLTFSACDESTVGTRDYCVDASASTITLGEPCSASGHQCVNGFCLADAGGACSPGCSGSLLSACDDAGINIGIDCKAFGAQACVTNGALNACKAARGGSCAPDTAVTCDGGVAIGCPSGVQESVNCTLLTQQADHCNAAAIGQPWNVARACFSAGRCIADSCSGATLTSCIGGVTYTTTCGAPFTGCATTPASADGPNARCVIPGR